MVCGCMICVFTQGKQNIGSTELLILDGGICCPIVDIAGNLTHYAPSCVMAL